MNGAFGNRGNEMKEYSDKILIDAWNRIDRECEKMGFSYRRLGDMAGLGHSLKNYSESAKNNIAIDTKVELFEKICRVLNKPLDYILFGSEIPFKEKNPKMDKVLSILLSTLFADGSTNYEAKILSLLPYLTKDQTESVRLHILSYFG